MLSLNLGPTPCITLTQAPYINLIQPLHRVARSAAISTGWDTQDDNQTPQTLSNFSKGLETDAGTYLFALTNNVEVEIGDYVDVRTRVLNFKMGEIVFRTAHDSLF